MLAVTPRSQLGWLTGSEGPGDISCCRVFFPANYLPALLGALAILGRVENWQQDGTDLPEDVAQAFLQAYQRTLKGGACMQPGTVFAFAGSSVPYGALLCDGTTYQIDDYPELFDAISNTFGGNGTTTFNVPDLRASFIVGTGDDGVKAYALGDTGGEHEHTLTTPEMPSHGHTFGQDYTINTLGEVPTFYNIDVWGFTGQRRQVTVRDSGGDLPHENRPPFLALAWYIKAF